MIQLGNTSNKWEIYHSCMTWKYTGIYYIGNPQAYIIWLCKNAQKITHRGQDALYNNTVF